MWWVNKFGNVSGPYSEDQIRKLVQTNRLTRLCKISEYRAVWMRLDESMFWMRAASGAEELELPSAALPGLKIGGNSHGCITQAGRNEPDMHKENISGGPEINPGRKKQPRRFRFPVKESHAKLSEQSNRRRFVIIGSVCVFVLASIMIVGVAIGSLSKRNDAEKQSKGDDSRKPLVEENEEARAETTKNDKTTDDGVTFESIKRKVAIIRTTEASGTGFFLKMGDRVFLVTNEHVIRSAETPRVSLIDGTDVPLGAFSIAEDRDLARYEVQGKYEYFVLSDGLPNNDDPIWVFGNSSGDGVVTTLRGHVTGVGGMTLKIDAEIVGGNSGSPIVDAGGKVVGIASYLKNGSNGRDWTTRDTEFDKVRRFGLRFTGVRWLGVDKKAFAEECGRMAAFEEYYSLLLPYLRCMDVSDEEFAKLKLEQKDIDRKRFGNYDEGFHDMLVDLSKAFDGKGRSWSGWMAVMNRRDAVIKELNAAIASDELTYENAVRALDDFDRKNDITKKWDKVKERNRTFIAKRKEALLMARTFLTGHDWHDPRMRRSDGNDSWGSVNWYLDAITFWLDQNAQKLKDINAALKNLEKGDEDED